MKPLRVYISNSPDPWFNIATEDWLFRTLNPVVETLYLWRNDRTVVIGRTQNPWTECNLKRMEEDGVKLARRVSGGGAVYHDLGTSIFTFISPKESYSRARNNEILIRALNALHVAAEVSGRNDLVIPFVDGPRKISGSAFRETRDRAFHHGTLLLNTDLDHLSQYLTPNPKKLESKGKVSVRSRVGNLIEINPEITHTALTDAIIKSFFETYNTECELTHLDPDELVALPDLKERYDHFRDWNWRYGQSPDFTHLITFYSSWGFFEIHVQASEGRIQACKIFSDTLYPDLIPPLQSALIGSRYESNGIKDALTALAADEAFKQLAQPLVATELLHEFGERFAGEVEV